MFSKIWKSISRKAIYVIIAAIVSGLKIKWPDLPLPSTDLIVDAVLALLACHTLTDVSAIAATAIGEYFKEKK